MRDEKSEDSRPSERVGLLLLVLFVGLIMAALYPVYATLSALLKGRGLSDYSVTLALGALPVCLSIWDGVVFYALAPVWKRVMGEVAYWPAFIIGFAAGPGGFGAYGAWLYVQGGVAVHTPLWLAIPGWLVVMAAFIGLAYVGDKFGEKNMFGYYVYHQCPPTRLVSSGAFGRVRNPTYALLICAAFGLALFRGTLSAFLGVVVLWLTVEIIARFEERHLLVSIGEPFREYMKRVPRFFPRLW